MKKKKTKKRNRLKHIADAVSESLNEKQKLFCELYIVDKDCFGNASKAYRTAYSLTPTQYKSAEVSAHRLLRNDKLKKYINHLLDSQFNDKAVDRQLSKVIEQDKDLPAKVTAIKEFNKLKQRIIEKTDLTTGGGKIVFLPPEILHKHGINENTSSDAK